MQYRPMTIDDYDDVIALWTQVDGLRLRDADSREGIGRYLERNPGLSFLAIESHRIAGTIMAGHDGKRGYIQHLTVADSHRRRGIASKLVFLCLDALANEGILKSHVMVLSTNQPGKTFWQGLAWQRRSDIELYSFINGGRQNT